jgi:hypothetical protein
MFQLFPVYNARRPDEINFSAAVDRIRVTGAIPEPSICNSIAGASIWLVMVARRRIGITSRKIRVPEMHIHSTIKWSGNHPVVGAN